MSEGKVFHLWIEYLKEAGYDNWSPQVKIDFAGCLEAPDIDKWIWRENYERGLFHNSLAVVPTVTLHDDSDDIVPGRQLVLAVDCYADLDDIAEGVRAFVKLVREEIGWTRPEGSPKFEPEPAKYKLAARPDVQALKTTLDAHRLITANPTKDLWEICELMMKTHDIGSQQRNKPSAGSNKYDQDLMKQRKTLGNIMSRYKKRAGVLLRGVARGEFPASADPQ